MLYLEKDIIDLTPKLASEEGVSYMKSLKLILILIMVGEVLTAPIQVANMYRSGENTLNISPGRSSNIAISDKIMIVDLILTALDIVLRCVLKRRHTH